MMLVASLNMLVRRWDGHPAGSLTWTALLLGATASLAANIAAAPPTLIGRLVPHLPRRLLRAPHATTPPPNQPQGPEGQQHDQPALLSRPTDRV